MYLNCQVDSLDTELYTLRDDFDKLSMRHELLENTDNVIHVDKALSIINKISFKNDNEVFYIEFNNEDNYKFGFYKGIETSNTSKARDNYGYILHEKCSNSELICYILKNTYSNNLLDSSKKILKINKNLDIFINNFITNIYELMIENTPVVPVEIVDITGYLNTPVIYIVTTKSLAGRNLFKIGRSSNFKGRLSDYNSINSIDEPCYCVYIKGCKNEVLIEYIIKYKLYQFREKNTKEIHVINYNFAVDIIDMIINSFS